MPGRGGAGNILNLQQEQKHLAEDVESNAQHLNPALGDTWLPRDRQQYAYTGRGGAGNWYSPKRLQETGTYDDRLPTALDASTQQTSASLAQGLQTVAEPARRYGRGGAGNMLFGVSEDEERAIRKTMQEDENKREKLKADVEASVNAILAEPPKAKLSGTGPL